MNEQIRYALALTQVKGLGLHTLKLLLEKYHSPKNIFRAATTKQLRMSRQGTEIFQQLTDKHTFQKADQIITQCQKSGIQILFLQDKTYPELLKHIQLPPLLLYTLGNIEILNHQPAIALIGTRRMTRYGQKHIAKLCEVLAPHKATIICGLGEGVERCATEEAISHGLSPIVVYPAGLQHPYPKTVPLALIQQAQEKGCLISEYPPNETLQRYSFLARNRVIVGLSQQLVLIESAKTGGSIPLAQLAQNENRDVQAIPGDIDKTRSEGTNLLIRRNIACLLTSANDLLHALDLQQIDPQNHSTAKIEHTLSNEERKIVEILGTSEKGSHIDLISERSALPLDQLSILLFNLECRNIIELLPGNSYRLRLQ